MLVALGVVLRLAGLTKDLWLDEIWSIQVASQMHSALDVFRLHHEINHHLNTLWLYVVGAGAPAAVYHLPSFACGIATVAIVGVMEHRRSPTAGLATLLLFATSYELVLYSTEARGYAGVVLWSIVAFYCLETLETTETRRTPALLAAYWACGVLGILSHPIYAGLLGAACLWTAVRSYEHRRAIPPVVRDLAVIHGVPVVALAVLYLFDLRLVVAGGGTPTASLIEAYGGAYAWAVGTLPIALAELLSCIAAVVLLDAGLRAARSIDLAHWAFFVGAIVVFPIALIAVRGSDLVYTRHFLIATTFLLLLLGRLIGSWWAEGRRARAALVLTAFVALNGWSIGLLAERGRGQHAAAIELIASRSGDSSVTIGGDHGFRIGMETLFFLAQSSTSKKLEYVAQGSWPAGGPDWLVTHRESFLPFADVQKILTNGGPTSYELAGVFPTAPLSGLHWFVYRKRVAQ